MSLSLRHYLKIIVEAGVILGVLLFWPDKRRAHHENPETLHIPVTAISLRLFHSRFERKICELLL